MAAPIPPTVEFGWMPCAYERVRAVVLWWELIQRAGCRSGDVAAVALLLLGRPRGAPHAKEATLTIDGGTTVNHADRKRRRPDPPRLTVASITGL
jgi:hypothetical protein